MEKSNKILIFDTELLDPFDAILLAIAISSKPHLLISRDKSFLKIASNYIPSSIPEDFTSTS